VEIATLMLACVCMKSEAQSVIANVPMGSMSLAMAINSVTNKIYVANYTASGQVTVVDGATNATSVIPVGSYPEGIAVNTVTNQIYVTNSGSDSLTIIDGSTQATTTVSVGVFPTQVVVDSKRNKIYVLNQSLFGTITVIDGATRAVTDNIFAGYQPSFLTMDPVLNLLYPVAGTNNAYTVGTPTVYSINAATDSIYAITFGTHPEYVAVNPTNSYVFIATVQEGGINVVPYSNGVMQGYYTVGNGFQYGQIGIDTSNNTAYVIDNSGSGALGVVDGNAFTYKSAPSGPNPGGVAVDSLTHIVYAANTVATGTVTALDELTGLTTTIPAVSYPSTIAVNESTNRVYVLNDDPAGTLTVISGLPATEPPAVLLQPQSQTVASGSTVVFNTAAKGRPAPTYQWTLNGAPLTDGGGVQGSQSGTLVVSGATAAQDGAYACTVTNSSGSVSSSAASLSVITTPTPGRIVNLSSRAYLTATGGSVSGSELLIAGFVIGGTGNETVVLRGVGPTLTSFGVSGAVNAPSLSLLDSATPADLIGSDSGWQSPPTVPTSGPWSGVVTPTDAVTSDFTQVGAFVLPSGSLDSALKASLPPGAYSSEITAAGGGGGVVLAEIYDDTSGNTGAQLVNISSRAFVADGSNLMIAGFVISGSSAETVLIRASGPALVPFGLSTSLPDPQLQLFDADGNLVASNTKWGGNPGISKVATRVGAFAWPDSTSADSALLLTLPPGSYTAEVTGLSGDAGIALVEVYAVP
jgi:YVTN family beta-propeller protein